MTSTLYGGSVGEVHGHTLKDFESSSFLGGLKLIGMILDELCIDEIFLIGPYSTNAILFFDLFMDTRDEFLIDVWDEKISKLRLIKRCIFCHVRNVGE